MIASEIVVVDSEFGHDNENAWPDLGSLKHGPLISPGRLEFLTGVYDQTALFACREYAQLVDLTMNHLLVADARMADRV